MKKGMLKRIFVLCLTVTVLCAIAMPALADSGTQLASRINWTRLLLGRSTLRMDSTLCQVASARVEEMAEQQGASGGMTAAELMQAGGLKALISGELVAQNLRSPDAVMLRWMTNGSSRATLLRRGYTKLGVSNQWINGVSYWCAVFSDNYYTMESGIVTYGNTTVTTVKKS